MERLEAYISSFSGCAVISSHDRTFLDIATDMTLSIANGRITLFPGSYSEWKADRDEKAEEEKRKVQEKPQRKPQREKKGLTYKEKKEKETLEAEIEELESLAKKLEDSFLTASDTEFGTLKERTIRYEETKKAIEEKTERWMELAEKEEQ